MKLRDHLPEKLRLYIFRKKFRKKRKTKVFPNNIFDDSCIKNIGRHSYGPITVYTWGKEGESLKIGNFVSFANDVTFVLGGNHPYERISTFPFNLDFPEFDIERPDTKGEIVVGDDVWFGMKSMIMSGVTIGQGAIVAAGSVVTRDIPPYAIVAGVPAKIVKYRFSNEICDVLNEKLNWETVDDKKIVKLHDLLQKKLMLN